MPKKLRRRALAFSGGGLDTVMQMGVAHALLVSRSAAPDYVVGVSAGAVNAAAIAEVLQAGPEQLSAAEHAALSDADRLPFQVDRLRNFLQTYVELPRTAVSAIMPDSLEVQARDPLKPLELPIHFDRERQAREAANESKAGLVNLINDLFDIPLTIATATRIIRRILGITESRDEPRHFVRFRKRITNEGLLLLLIWNRFRETSALAGAFLWAWVIGPNRAVLRGTQGAATADRLMRTRPALNAVLKRLRTAVQWFTMAHLFVFGSALWGLSLPVRIFVPNASPRPWRFLEPVKRVVVSAAKWCAKVVPSPLTRVLQYYNVADGLANTDVIKQMLVRCFDPHYYGRTDLTTFLNRSLDRRNRPEPATDSFRKRLCDYSARKPEVFVAPVAADVDTGDMVVIDPAVPVVDALLAATAIVPFLPAVRIDTKYEGERREKARVFREQWRDYQEKSEAEWIVRRDKVRKAREDGQPIESFPPPADAPHGDEVVPPEGGRWFIDATNISNEAIGPLLAMLRKDLPEKHDQTAAVDVYPVSNLPISKGTLPSADGERFDGVLDVVPRALQLKRFRDASVEQRLTDLFTKALPETASYYTVGNGRTFVRANIFPLELEKPVGMNYRLITGVKVDYADSIYQTVADGCRATMEAALPSTIAATAETGKKSVKCALVIKTRLNDELPLPGSDELYGPGLSEICRQCALKRDGTDRSKWQEPTTLRVIDERQHWPEWPRNREEPQDEVQAPNPRSGRMDINELGDWPRKRDGISGNQRALVSLLFGGGVFRGVFHMGVANALSEIGIHPDVVAGSSVGSIIAAMIAQVFSNPAGRGRDIAHLAATFLSIDRLVLTDRFADFVRRLTLRAADTPIALRDLDYLFRRFEHGSAAEFNNRMRLIAAGVERLTYVSPFELLELTREARLEQFSQLISELRNDVQDFLDRGGVGQEILGSEPLVNLIEHHILSGRRSAQAAEDDLFESFRESGIFFLATATNIDAGDLEILGGDVLAASRQASLRYGLLASSAFPAVFRPRQSWEIFRKSNVMEQYIDGGVIDNLPLDAVARFLDRASGKKTGAVVRRPSYDGKPVPHLIFTASLEVDPSVASTDSEGIGNCLAVSKRASTFKYNRKIDAFATTQADLRLIHESYPVPDLLDLHVIAVKPKWLCSTFGFHPMLGFRRRKQKQSIAHGCASTFATIYEMQQANPDSTHWLKAWGAKDDLRLDPDCFHFVNRHGERVEKPVWRGTYVMRPAPKRPKGDCWFREGVPCPFSRNQLEQAHVARQKVDELEEIYRLCGNPATHRPA